MLEVVRCRPYLLGPTEEDFFSNVTRQLQDMNVFFKGREQQLAGKLYELEKEVEEFMKLKNSLTGLRPRKIKNQESTLKMAYSELYLGLSLLQNFQQLNYTGFRKILKKFDKLAGSERGKQYFLEKVTTAEFYVSPRVAEMIATAEHTMIEKLEEGNRHKAMKTLRVPPLEAKGQASHWDTFKAGLYMGIFVISLIVLCVAAALRPPESWGDTTAIVSGMRGILILVCWFYGFAINTYIWRRKGVNNVLIFEFDPRHNLNYIQLLEVGVAVGGGYLLLRAFNLYSLYVSCSHNTITHNSPLQTNLMFVYPKLYAHTVQCTH